MTMSSAISALPGSILNFICHSPLFHPIVKSMT
jgi:hypothetical protein